MTDTFEKKLLTQILAQLDGEPKPKRRAFGLLTSLTLWFLAVCVALLYLRFGSPARWKDLLIGLACLGFGHYWSYRLYEFSYIRQWTILVQHFDRTRIEARLRELGV